MNYEQMNLTAFSGTAEELKEMLFKYGHDKNNVIAIQNALEGEDVTGRVIRMAVTELEAKNKIMAEFRAKTGDFAPQSAESKLAREFNRMAVELQDLKNRNKDLEQQLAAEKTKHRNCPHEHPGIH